MNLPRESSEIPGSGSVDTLHGPIDEEEGEAEYDNRGQSQSRDHHGSKKTENYGQKDVEDEGQAIVNNADI